MRQIKASEKIFTCSNTLQLLVDKFKHLAKENEWLSERNGALEDENFNMQRDLQEHKKVSRYLSEQSKMQLDRLEALVSENRRLKARVDYLSKQNQEHDIMREHENGKILRDTQYFKDRCDQALLNLKHNEKKMVVLEGMRLDCEEI